MVCNAPDTSSTLQMSIDVLRVLPGVSPKSAQRMARRFMQHNREDTT